MAAKITVKDLERKPGPGNYDPDYKKIYFSNPSFSIPSKHKPFNPDQTPAPNAVNVLSFSVLNQGVSYQPIYALCQI